LLATADEGDDFEAIAWAEDGFRVAGSRHDFEVYFDGDVGLGDVELTKERGDRRAIGHVARLAVDFNLHGSILPLLVRGRLAQHYCGSRMKVVRNWALSRNWITSTCGLPAACSVEFHGMV
jgi:hypothetical protein